MSNVSPSNLAILLWSIYPLDTLAKVHLDICEYTFTYTHTHTTHTQIKIATAIWNSKKKKLENYQGQPGEDWFNYGAFV